MFAFYQLSGSLEESFSINIPTGPYPLLAAIHDRQQSNNTWSAPCKNNHAMLRFNLFCRYLEEDYCMIFP